MKQFLVNLFEHISTTNTVAKQSGFIENDGILLFTDFNRTLFDEQWFEYQKNL